MALGLVDQAIEPAVSVDGSVVAVMDGEIYDYDEQRIQLAAKGRVCRSDSRAELLLHGYESQGREFFRGLHGKFIAAIWDGGARRTARAGATSRLPRCEPFELTAGPPSFTTEP